MILIKIMKNKYHFRHRSHRDLFTYLLDNLVRGVFSVRCIDLSEYKPMQDSTLKCKIFKQRTEEQNTIELCKAFYNTFQEKAKETIKEQFDNLLEIKPVKNDKFEVKINYDFNK